MVRSRHIQRRRAIARSVVLIVVCALALFPCIYILLTSFKTRHDVLSSPPTFLPPTWSLSGYEQVFQSNMLLYYLPNTMINALVTAALVVPLATLSGYAFARYRFWGSASLQLVILGLLMLPLLTNLVPLYRLASEWNILSTNRVMIAVHISGGLPLSIWIAKSFFERIPRELEEAALIDGATRLEVLRHVTGPLALPGIFFIFLINLVEAWNEFLPAVVLLTIPTSKTATVGLLDFQSQFEIAYHVQAAASVMIAAPVVLLFLLTHRLFFVALLR